MSLTRHRQPADLRTSRYLSLRARPPGRNRPWARLLRPGWYLLQRPRVAVGIAEVDEGPPRLNVHLTGLHAAVDQLPPRRLHVRDDDLDPLLRAGRHLGDPGAQHYRAC